MTDMASILLVEDNEADIRLTEEAFRDAKISVRLSVARDGDEAMRLLRQGGPAARPDLVLLDLNMPRKDGREVLRELKQDPLLKRIPVLVLTTSEAEGDIRECYELHANCYLTKPVDLDGFVDAVRKIEEFWLRLVKLPPR